MCSVAVAEYNASGILRLDDTNVTYTPSVPSSFLTRTPEGHTLLPCRETKRTMATVVRPDDPRWLPMLTPPTRFPVLGAPPHSRSESE